MFDRFERPITYLRISVTDKCNLRCRYCMPPEGAPLRRHDELLTLEALAEAARAAVGLGVTKVRLTGGEPLVRRGIVELVRMLAGIEGLEHLGMTTNGTLLAPRARELRGAGLPVKVNMVVLGDTSDEEIGAMREFCASIGARLQLINHFELTRSNDSGRWDARWREAGRLDAAGGGCSFDRPPSCAGCNRIRLLADGTLKPCLHSDEEIRLEPARLTESFREAILAKPRLGGTCTSRSMRQIGG